jgi:adenine-specific DNA-methyltransferase
MSAATLSYRAWQFNLGLLPVPLYMGQDDDRRHVLLNGIAGNFCLDEQTEISPLERATLAWSSNTGHHLSTNREYVEVVRWDQPDKIERFTARSVGTNLEEFHRYLERNSPERLNGVVSHALGVYRSIRSALDESETGTASLGAFLYLIHRLESGQDAGTASAGLLPPTARKVFQSLRSEDQAFFAERLSGQVGSYRMMRPDLTLLLRHASGALFQEAHAQVELPSQNWLPGLGPADALPSFTSGLGAGAYFTPPSIARTLAEESVRQLDVQGGQAISIFDPACGSGELLKEALRILEIKGYAGNVTLRGWDTSQAAVDIATFSLGWEARGWNGRVQVDIRLMDSLVADAWPVDADLILMNPPFKSWQQMSDIERDAAIARLGALQSNKPNLASVFIERARQTLNEGGVLASVAPRSFFEGTSAKSLRTALSESFSLRLVANLANASLFQYAMVQSGFLVARKSNGDEAATVVWTDPQASTPAKALRGLRRFQLERSVPVAESSFSVYKDPEISKGARTWLPRPYDAWALDKLLRQRGSFVSAKSLYEIHQGVRMGSDAFLVDSEFWSRLSAEEQRFFRPAVTNTTLEDGRLQADAYIFYPYTAGLPRIGSEDELREYVPEYYERVLLPQKEALADRKSLVKAGQSWWGLIWPREWQYKPAKKLVSKYFGKRGAFGWDESGEFVVVVGHGWIPRDSAKHWQHVTSDEYAHGVIAILASEHCEVLLSQCSVQVGGGQWDLSSKYVGDLLLPAPTRSNAPMIRDLAVLGAKISRGDSVANEPLDDIVAAAYGLPHAG